MKYLCLFLLAALSATAADVETYYGRPKVGIGVLDIVNDKILFSDTSAPAGQKFKTISPYNLGVAIGAGGGGGFDSTGVDAVTWSDGASASNLWTFNVSGTDPTLLFGNGAITVGGDLTVTGSATFATMSITGALTAGSFEFEGSTADGFETTMSVVDPTADNAINLPNASGTVALSEIVVKHASAAYTLGTTDIREQKGGIVYVTSTGTQSLPAIAAGMSVTYFADAAVVVTIDPNGSEIIRLNGVDLAAGFAIKSTGAIGEMVVLTYHGAGKWYAATAEFITNGS